jgi:DNA-binding CsgD family transcriptional regulator
MTMGARRLLALGEPDFEGVVRARARVVTFRLGGVKFAVLSVPLDGEDVMAELSSCEREVATLAASGLTNAAIAKCRGRSDRTVANQMASILRKLRVGSRYELAARLALCSVETSDP